MGYNVYENMYLLYKDDITSILHTFLHIRFNSTYIFLLICFIETKYILWFHIFYSFYTNEVPFISLPFLWCSLSYSHTHAIYRNLYSIIRIVWLINQLRNSVRLSIYSLAILWVISIFFFDKNYRKVSKINSSLWYRVYFLECQSVLNRILLSGVKHFTIYCIH